MGRKKSAVKIDDGEYSLPQDDESKDNQNPQIRNQNNMFIGLDDANGDCVSGIVEEKPSSVMVDEDPMTMVFSGKKKKKSSKSKKVSTFSALDDVDEDREVNSKDTGTIIELEEVENKVESVEEIVSTKKQNKKNKKKNKSGRTNLEEEDLDRILAELDGTPTTVTPLVPVSKASSSTPVVEEPAIEVVDKDKVEEVKGVVDKGMVEEVEVVAESAAEKKKRKKKEKEKEKKAAAAAAKEENETKGKMADNKKVPKAVLVIHGYPDLMFEKKSWIALNTGSFLLRNCQWSLDLLDAWAPMGPKGSVREEAGKILTDYLDGRPAFEADDQSALIYLLLTKQNEWMGKVFLENSYYLHGFWVGLVDKYEEMMEKYHPGFGDEKWPFVTHFVGCKPCGSYGDYPVERCLSSMERAFNFADNQVLQMYGFAHKALSTPKLKKIRDSTATPLKNLDDFNLQKMF